MKSALEFINHHRATHAPFQGPLEPAAAGWTEGDVHEEALRLGWGVSISPTINLISGDIELTQTFEGVEAVAENEFERLRAEGVAIQDAIEHAREAGRESSSAVFKRGGKFGGITIDEFTIKIETMFDENATRLLEST